MISPDELQRLVDVLDDIAHLPELEDLVQSEGYDPKDVAYLLRRFRLSNWKLLFKGLQSIAETHERGADINYATEMGARQGTAAALLKMFNVEDDAKH